METRSGVTNILNLTFFIAKIMDKRHHKVAKKVDALSVNVAFPIL